MFYVLGKHLRRVAAAAAARLSLPAPLPLAPLALPAFAARFSRSPLK